MVDDVGAASQSPSRPFVRWAGSKRRLLSQILPHLPVDYGTYIEPFLGGGSLYLALKPGRAILNDACEPLIETWKAIARDPEGVHEAAHRFPLEKGEYYRVRQMSGGTANERAGRFIYLNRGAFNGLYRVNLRGGFNVPWGAPKTSNIIDLSHLVAVSEAIGASSTQFRAGDFEETVDEAGAGDLVFVDPPYVTSHNNNGFVAYNEKIFSWKDQERLAAASLRALERGAHVIVTNAHHDNIIALYRGYRLVVLERASTLAAATSRRGRTTEVLLLGGSM